MLDPLGTLAEFFANIANTFGNWYTDAIKGLITFLMSSALPSSKDIQSDFFRLNFGGSIGLALYIMTAISLLVLLAFLLTPRRDHSMKISRYISSIVGLIVYAVLFFRLYVYVDDAENGLIQFALNFITSSKTGSVDKINNLLAVTSPSAVGSVVVLGVFSVVLAWFAGVVAFSIKMVVFIVLIVYPLLIVLRPLGYLAVIAFNAANSFLLVAILSPVITVWAIALPLVIRNVIPGADSLGLTAIITLVCSAGAFFGPIILLVIFFRLSSQIFGNIDVQGNVAITSLPALSWDEAMRDMQDKRGTPFKDAFSSFPNDATNSLFEEGGMKSLIDSIPDTIVGAGAVAASTQFGPWAGVVIEGVYGKAKSHFAESNKATPDGENPRPEPKE